MITAALAIIPSILGWYRAKQEAQMAWYKIMWEATCNITKFVIKNAWMIFKVLVLLWVLWQWNADYNGRVDAEKALIAHVANDAEAARQRDIENEVKRVNGKLQVMALQRSHREQTIAILTHANKTIDKLKKDAKDEKTLNDSKLAAMRDGLQLAVQRQADSSTFGLSSHEQDRFAIGNGDATLLGQLHEAQTDLEVCQEAGAVCTADYNYCRDYVKSQHKKIGVESD
jgi:hypothetical protein